MITRCSECRARFEVSAELLQAQDATVRCGECLSVFDARAQLIVEDPIGAGSGVSGNMPAQSNREKHQRSVVRTQAADSSVKAPIAATTAAESFAHIDEEDIENAATIVLDETQSNDSLSGQSGLPGNVSGDRVNDGFYSPDLDTSSNRDPSVSALVTGKGHKKIDPVINTETDLDSTSLEFERTLALEGLADVFDETVQSSSVVPEDVHSMNLSEFLAPDGNNSRAQLLTTQQLPRSGTTTPYIDRRSGEALSAAELEQPDFGSGREYSHRPDDVLSRQAQPLDPNRHTRDVVEESAAANLYEPDYEDPQYEDPQYQEPEAEQDSASELRRYVNSRGGKVYPDSNQSQNIHRRRSHSSLIPLLSLLLIGCGCLYLARHTIATMNLPEPVLATFCGLTGCELPVQKDIDQLTLVRHQMSSHQSLENVLVISVDLINRARFPQPYPVLVVSMANGQGQAVAFRKFQPEEYLEPEELSNTLPASEPVRIKFEIIDPGVEASSSELSFE